MKKQGIFLLGTGCLLIIGIIIALSVNNGVRADLSVPTPAPTRTVGPPPTAMPFARITLEHPLTKEEAVAKAFEADQRVAQWEKSWSPATLASEPERISVQWYKDRSYDGSEPGEGVANGPIWVVTIKGLVKVPMWDHQNNFHDGISYEVSQGTGEVWGFVTGPAVSK